jgi:protein-tyrosine phosphatase
MNKRDRKLPAETSVLFVCLGNICRSPAAEGIMRHIVEQRGLADRFRIDSAGIGSWHVGQLPDRRMRACGERHGYAFDSRARQFCPADFDRFDYIVAMDEENRCDLLHQARNEDDRRKLLMMAHFLHSHPGRLLVPDPYYGDTADFELVIDLLKDACDGLLDYILENAE